MYSLPDLSYQKILQTPEELLKHCCDFKIHPKFSVGIWCLNSGGGRFHEPYTAPKTIKERLDLAAELAELGITGIEAHYPAEINIDNLHLYKDLEKKSGIKLIGVPFSHFYEKDFEFGALSNPDKKIRQKAITIASEALRIVKETGASCAISWPGIDGYTYPLGTNYFWMWDFFEGAMAEVLDTVPGVRIAIEPKPYEPAPNNIYRTTAEGILAAQRIESRLGSSENLKLLASGQVLVGLNPEIGHVRMGYEDAACAYSMCLREGRLAHTHWNSQPAGNYDQDLNVGVVEWQQAEALLYALKIAGYKEYFGLDINPERMPPKQAIRLSIKAITRMNERIEKLPHNRLMACYLDPSAHRGEIEEILIDAM
ncbi:MAG: xylose isomerase [Spirochaetes bacterium GWF1_41_5]|nr:MAG: xylose isomerase [Spirochaetes bacterium GWF1_41_5]